MPNPREEQSLSNFQIQRQPDDTTCGPTCLHAIYRYFEDDSPLEDMIAQVPSLEGGGTLGVLLATHARSRGYRVKLVTLNLQVFDPTWFADDGPALRERLLARAEARRGEKIAFACHAYADFLEAGGEIEFRDLEPVLIRRYLRKGVPILTGLSATFLYREARERAGDNEPDDIGGDPAGHFVVLTGYKSEEREVLVSDPLHPNPLALVHTYPVPMQRVIGAIYLGVLTHDANLIIIEPKESKGDAHRRRRQ